MSPPDGAERDRLIAAKGEVQARLGRARRELDRSQSALDGATGLRRRLLLRRVRGLESEVDRLMAEEVRLRLAIDRARR